MNRTTPVLASLLVALSLALSACGGSGQPPAWINTPPPAAGSSAPAAGYSTILTAKGHKASVYSSAASSRALKTVSAPNPQTPLVFLAIGSGARRWKVLLPTGGNGATAWIDSRDVTSARTRYRIEVHTRSHTLLLYRGASVLMRVSVGVGKTDTPTPLGNFFITQLLRSPDPSGPYGPYAYGISGQSTALKSWNGHDPIVGLHGTDHPELLGKSVSHGCIRMSNDVIRRLARVLPLGVPVEIKAIS